MNLNLKVTIKKYDMIKYLKQHRTEHVDNYKKALENYFRQLYHILCSYVIDADGGVLRDDNYDHDLRRPINREDEYDKYINMLEMCSEDEFTLSVNEFDAIINDTWNSDVVFAKSLNTTYLVQ